MKSRVLLAVAGWMGLACLSAEAIPPPWLLERMKAKADLIVIARMGKAAEIPNVKGMNRKMAFELTELLKGEVPKDGDAPAKLFLLYYRRPEVVGMFRPVVVGGTGHPKPAEGELALLFLRKHKAKGEFQVICGSFGHVVLTAKDAKARANVQRRLAGYRQTCKRVKDATLRKAMDGYYVKAIEAAKKESAAKP